MHYFADLVFLKRREKEKNIDVDIDTNVGLKKRSKGKLTKTLMLVSWGRRLKGRQIMGDFKLFSYVHVFSIMSMNCFHYLEK